MLFFLRAFHLCGFDVAAIVIVELEVVFVVKIRILNSFFFAFNFSFRGVGV